MPVTLKGMDQWERSIRENVGKWEITVPVDFEVTDDEAMQVYKKLPEKLEAWLQEFVGERLLGKSGGEGILKKEWEERTSRDREFWPTFVQYPNKRRSNVQEVGKYERKRERKAKIPRMDAGFARMWEIISHSVYTSQRADGAAVGVGKMSEVEAPRLNSYMGTSGSQRTRSQLNTLFYAIEFGTGIAENVGGSENVRLTPTKEGHRKYPGSWWFESPSNTMYDNRGALFLGQKGFHFLYDERTRSPLPIYKDYFHRHFPRFVQAKLGQKLRVSNLSAE